MSKKDFAILFSVFAITGSAIYKLTTQTRTTPVTTSHEARLVAEKELKKTSQSSKVQILKIEQVDDVNFLGEGWLIYHTAQVHKNKPLFVSADGSIEYIEDQNFNQSDREPSTVKE